MKWTPTAIELRALRRIDALGVNTKPAAGRIPGIARRTLTALFRKSLVEWGGPVYFGHVFPTVRGRQVLRRAAGRSS